MKTRTTLTERGQEPSVQREVFYRRGTMRRKEATANLMSIANCDSKTGFLVDTKAHEYRTYKVVRFWSGAQVGEYLQKNPGSAVQLESQTIDTGERKTFFGYPAKHLITTIRRPGDTLGAGEEILDGWYIDHERPDNNCAPEYTLSNFLYIHGTTLVTYPEVPQFKHIGLVPDGLAVQLTYTVKPTGTKDGGAGRTLTAEETVEDLSDAPVSPSLFELPLGLHENPQLLRGQSSSPR